MNRPALAQARKPAIRANGRHEAEAAEAARRSATGETGLRRLLSPAPVAAAPSRGAGVPLPGALRRDMETAFGADLAAVRLHIGSEAARIAADRGARALAAGRGLWFAEGAFAPGNVAGRALIAHEIAHVLQQTGRPAGAGFAAREAYGLAPPQAETDKLNAKERELRDKTLEALAKRRTAESAKLKAQSDARWEKVGFDTLVRAHGLIAPDRAAFDRLAAAVAKDLGIPAAASTAKAQEAESGDGDPADTPAPAGRPFPVIMEDQINGFVARIDSREYQNAQPDLFGPRGVGTGFLHDCLKKLGRFDAAAKLMRDDPTLRTLAFHFGLNEEMDTQADGERVAALAAAIPEIVSFRRRFFARLKRMLLAPGLEAGPLTRAEDIEFLDQVANTDLAGDDIVAVGENELRYKALAMTYSLEVERAGLLSQWGGEAKGASPPADRLRLARMARWLGLSFQAFTGAKHGYIETRFAKDAGAEIEKAASAAITFWENVIAPLDPGDALIQAMRDDKATAALHPLVMKEAETFFALEKGGADLPLPAAYAARVAKFRARLLAAIRSGIDPTLAESKALDAGASPRARALAQLLQQLQIWAVAPLDAYDAGADSAASLGEGKRDDVRGAHRLRFASQLFILARLLNWEDLRARAESWTLSADRAHSQLYLLSPWTQTPDADPSDLGREISKEIANWPVSGPALTTFFRFVETQARAEKLEQLLAAPPAAGQRPLYRQVNRLVADLPLPRRWAVADYLFALKPALLTPLGLEAARPGASGDVALSELNETERQALEAAVSNAGDEVSLFLSPREGVDAVSLIRDHPLTGKLIKSLPPGVDLVIPRHSGLMNFGVIGAGAGLFKVFAWEVPSFDLLIGYMRGVESFNKIVVDANLKDAGATPKLQAAWLESLSAGEWSAKFIDATAKFATAAAFSVEEVFGAMLKRERERYGADLRRAAVVERQIVVTDAGGRLADDSLEARILGPRDVMERLRGLATEIFPPAQLQSDPALKKVGELQIAVALLQLAPALIASYRVLEDDALIAGYWDLIEPALESLKNPEPAAKAAGLEGFAALLSPPDMAMEPLLARRTLLEQLLAKLKQSAREHQFRVGFRGLRSESDTDFAERAQRIKELRKDSALARLVMNEAEQREAFLTGLYHPWRVGADRKIKVAGTVWTLTEVINDFTYIPSYGPKGSKAHADPILLLGFVTENFIERWALLDDLEKTEGVSTAGYEGAVAQEKNRIGTNMPLLRLTDAEGNEQLITGLEKDWAFLDELARVTTVESILVGLEDLSDLTHAFADIMMEVAVTIFGAGVGQYAKTAADIMQILASDEMAILVDAFQKDPLKLVAQVKDELIDRLFQPETLIRFLLFPNSNMLERLLSFAHSGRESSPGKRAKAKGGFAAPITAMLDLGAHVAAEVDLLHKRVEGPFGALRGRIVSRPRLAGALNFAADYGPVVIDVLRAIQTQLAEHSDVVDTVLGFLEGKSLDDPKHTSLASHLHGLTDSKGPLNEGLNDTLGKLATFELPENIVPLEALIGAIGKIVLKLLARKPKFKAVLKAAETTHFDQLAYELIASRMRDTQADPNKYWREYVLAKIDAPFRQARGELMTNLFVELEKVRAALYEALPVDLFPTPPGRPQLEILQANVTGEIAMRRRAGDFATPFPDPRSAWPWPPLAPRLDASDGSPLPPALRREAEHRFGHDFRHVRLHAGDAGARATGPARALALTSGSHVYLNPSVSLAGGEGRHVLDHELAHVLQQTGPRPLGSQDATPPPPQRGATLSGLRYDWRLETAAERMARSARRREGGGPLRIEGGAEDGVLPLFDKEYVFRVVKLIGSYADVVEFQEHLDASKAPARGKHRGDAPSLKLWGEIGAELAKSANYAGAFQVAQAQMNIRAHLAKSNAKIQAAMPRLVDYTEPPEKKKKKEAKEKPEPPASFPLGRFANLLSGYVFAGTGIALDISVAKDWEKGPKTLDKVFVRYVNLGRIDLSDPLWRMNPLAGQIAGASSKGKIEPIQIKQRLAALGPLSDVWSSSEYKLNDNFLGKLISLRGNAAQEWAGDSEPPPKTDYVKTSAKDLKGLRIATHGEFTTAPSAKIGPSDRGKRESHHTTQFLLAEYFYNKKGSLLQPFQKGVDYPGLTWSDTKNKTGDPVEFNAPGKSPIRLEALYGKEGSRGAPMPAILLSYDAHRQGRLHLNRLRQWGDANTAPAREETEATPTQGAVLHGHFKGELPGYLKAVPKKGEALTTPERDAGKVASDIHTAMTATYRWLYSEVMGPALDEALPINELAYYRAAVANYPAAILDAKAGTLKPSFDMKIGDLRPVATDARGKNKTVMDSFGWVL